MPGLAIGATASFNQLIGRGTDYLVLGIGMTRLGGHGEHITAGTPPWDFAICVPAGHFFKSLSHH